MPVPVYKLTIRNTNEGASSCCQCDKTAGCECLSDRCALECRSKSGSGSLVATLCGFDEFESPSVPPKKYRRRRVHGDIDITEYAQSADCEGTVCQPSAEHSYSGGTHGGGSPFTWSGSYSVTPISETDTHVTFRVNSSVLNADVADVGHRLYVGANFYAVGDEFTLAKGTIVTVYQAGNYVIWLPISGSDVCMQAGATPPISDSWDVTQTYDADCNLTATNNTTRNGSDPIPGAAPNYRPDLLYVPRISPFVGPIQPTYTEVEVTPTSRVTTGLGCVDGIDFGPVSMSAVGEVTEELDVEDTEDDAMLRAEEGRDWVVGYCFEQTAYRTLRGSGDFSFAFRKVQFRVRAGSLFFPLIPGHTYEITVRIVQRLLGSSGPFVPLYDEVVTISADEPIEYSEWIDLQIDTGFETKATSCSIEDVTP